MSSDIVNVSRVGQLDRYQPEPDPARELLAATPKVRLGGLPIAILDRPATADLMLAAVRAKRPGSGPLIFSSANGEVISRCARDPEVARLFADADLLSADGQPLVLASRLLAGSALPERVATTDLFHDVAAFLIVVAAGLTVLSVVRLFRSRRAHRSRAAA